MGIPDHLICLLRNLYAGQGATVRTGHGTTDWFQIGKRVRQGCIPWWVPRSRWRLSWKLKGRMTRNFMNWSCKLTLRQRERDGGGGQPPVKSEVRAQSNTVGRLRFFWGGDAREHPGGLLRLDPAFAYAEPPCS